MNCVTGVLTRYCSKGVVLDIPLSSVKNFTLGLIKTLKWDIGIDQSTSCTGICIQSTNKEYQVLLDVQRDKALEKNVFYRDLFYLLKNIVEGQNIRMVIMEKPAPKAMYASRVLEELKGRVEEWILQIPEFEYAIVDSLYPQTWKSYVIDKSKGTHRSNNKRCIAEDLCDKFWLLKGYFHHHFSTDYDSFDACGILNGFLEYAYTPNGLEKIHGVKEKRHTSVVGYAWVEKSKPKSIVQILSKEGYEYFNPVVLAYNEHFNLHDNIRMASSNYKSCYTILPANLLNSFMWKYDIDPDDENRVLIMFILNKSKYSKGDLDYFKHTFIWNEEIYDK